MSKAILVIDIPDEWFEEKEKWFLCCEDASLKYEEDGSLMHFKDFFEDVELKPLPQKRDKHKGKIIVKNEEEANNMQILINQCCDIGFNACLDEILEEKQQ